VIVDYCFALWLLQRALSGGGRKKPTDVSARVAPGALSGHFPWSALRRRSSTALVQRLPVAATFLHLPAEVLGSGGLLHSTLSVTFRHLPSAALPAAVLARAFLHLQAVAPPRGGARRDVTRPPNRGDSLRRSLARSFSTTRLAPPRGGTQRR
jgi:hypothetical protein